MVVVKEKCPALPLVGRQQNLAVTVELTKSRLFVPLLDRFHMVARQTVSLQQNPQYMPFNLHVRETETRTTSMNVPIRN